MRTPSEHNTFHNLTKIIFISGNMFSIELWPPYAELNVLSTGFAKLSSINSQCAMLVDTSRLDEN